MVKNIWKDCDGAAHIGELRQKTVRIIEAQGAAATRKLVDSLEEQIVLEDMIETAKPRIPADYQSYHPLLYTAFRYPPLQYGSRFGSKFAPSCWYGSSNIRTGFAEKAFYQYHFLRASHADYGIVSLQLTSFAIEVRTNQGVNLTIEPFSKYKEIISSPASYEASQQLGDAMRKAGVDAFSYISARDPHHDINVGVISPHAFANKNPESRSFQTWQCIAEHHIVEFMRSSAIENKIYSFPVELFLLDGKLPFPAN